MTNGSEVSVPPASNDSCVKFNPDWQLGLIGPHLVTAMDESMADKTPPSTWKAAWVADLDRVAARDRWGVALSAIGWVHLGFFLVCQRIHSVGDRTGSHYVALWATELAVVLWIVRRVAGRHWYRSTPLAGLVARVWGTFLILSLNLASMNTMTGLDHEWFKPVLCTLSTFGFATMAYLISLRFFIPAVWMYFTGLLMVMKLDQSYLIYGVSWCGVLQGLAWTLERRRVRYFAPLVRRRMAGYRSSIAGAEVSAS
jgi:hypothetical protein